MSDAEVSSQLIRKILMAAAAMGADSSALMTQLGIPYAPLLDPESRLPARLLRPLWEAAGEATGDPNFGLHAAELSRRLPDNSLAVAVNHSRTLGEALDRMLRHTRLVHDMLLIYLDRSGPRATITVAVSDGEPMTRHAAEFTMAALCIFGRQNGGPTFSPLSISLCHPAPASTDELRSLLGVEPTFGAERNQFSFEARWLDHPMPMADPAVCAEFDAKLASLMNRLGGPSLIERVRKCLVTELRGGLPSVDTIAEKLNMSGRSLQRRLQAEGSSFQQELNEARCELACQYLGETSYPIMEVAFLLGFSELSAFHRAFKRWKHVTPGDYRAQRTVSAAQMQAR